MKIIKERTRLLFSEFTPLEKKRLDDLVGTDDNVFSYDDPDKGIVGFPPGMEKSVRRLFPNAQWIDQSQWPWKAEPIQPVPLNIGPRNQMQVDCINMILDSAKIGKKVAAIVPPGGGKTFMACYSAIKVGLRTLFIAPTSAIKQQWADTLTGMFGVDPTKVLLVTSPRQFVNVKADFVIVSQASLAALNKTFDLEAIMRSNKFGTKVIDEVQMWFHNIIRVDANCNIKNNWYLTGTFGRSGAEENRIYQEMFGDLNMFTVPNKKGNIFNPRPGDVYGQKPHMNVRMIWAKSHIASDDIAAISNTMRYAERAGKWNRYGLSVPAYAKLIVPEDGSMTPMLRTILRVCKMADHQVKYGTMLVLGNTINEAEIVAMHLRKLFPNYTIGTYHSRNDKMTNTKNKETCDILVSTVASAGTGFDWKGLAKLVQFASFASWILGDQVSGRLRRRDDGQDTWMWDIVDSDVNQLRAWANNRADVYKRKCKTFKVIDM